MSSCDSYLNTAAVAFSNDILLGFKLSDKQKLVAGRLSTIIIGIGAVIISYSTDDILTILLSTFEVWGPTLFPPLLMALFYHRLPKYFFYFPCFTGLSVLLVSKTTDSMPYTGGLIMGIVANFLCFLIFLQLFRRK